MQCEHADWPDDDAMDGSGSCRTFQALYCKKKARLVYKNHPCHEKVHRQDHRDLVKTKGELCSRD